MALVPDALLTRISRADIQLSIVGFCQRGGALAAFIGPLMGGLSAMKAITEQGWDGQLLLGGTLLALGGSAVDQGANWLAEKGCKGLDYDHSKRVTAGLRTLR